MKTSIKKTQKENETLMLRIIKSYNKADKIGFNDIWRLSNQMKTACARLLADNKIEYLEFDSNNQHKTGYWIVK